MDSIDGAEKAKASAKNRVNTAPIRVRRETKRRLLQELARLNKKDFGRNVRADDFIALAMTLVQPGHLEQLQEATLSNADRLQRRYQAYVKEHGPISKDAFLGKFLSAERIDTPAEVNHVRP